MKCYITYRECTQQTLKYMQQLFVLLSLFTDAYNAQLNILFRFFWCARVVLVNTVILGIIIGYDTKRKQIVSVKHSNILLFLFLHWHVSENWLSSGLLYKPQNKVHVVQFLHCMYLINKNIYFPVGLKPENIFLFCKITNKSTITINL